MKEIKTKKGRRRRKKKNRQRYRIGSIAFGIMFLSCALFLIISYGKQKQAEREYTSLRSEEPCVTVGQIAMRTGIAAVSAAEKEEIPHSDAPHLENTIDFSALQEKNADIYAWIQIPGTLVDYPVLQHSTDRLYYLNHTIDGTAGLPGSIYSEAIHPKDFSAPMTVLYGHNMRNDTMFGSLHDYEDPDKLTDAPYVYIYLPDKTLVYQIFAAVRFSDTYLPDYCDYEKESDFMTFVKVLCSSPGNINETVEVPYGSRLLMMSTCIGNAPNNRFLVGAVLIDEYEK